MIRKRFSIIGRVQGVGFRWRSAQAAKLYDCTGWCRNEWDSTVTMELQGDPDSIDAVLQILRNDRYIRIESMEAKKSRSGRSGASAQNEKAEMQDTIQEAAPLTKLQPGNPWVGALIIVTIRRYCFSNSNEVILLFFSLLVLLKILLANFLHMA